MQFSRPIPELSENFPMLKMNLMSGNWSVQAKAGPRCALIFVQV